VRYIVEAIKKKKARAMMKPQKILYAAVAISLILSLSACGSGASEPEEPVDISKFTYVNEDIGFGIIYPEEFTIFSDDEIRTAMADNIEGIRSMFQDPAQADEALERTIPVSLTMKHPTNYEDGFNANINIIVQKVPITIGNIVNISNQVLKETNIQTADVMTYGDATATQIGGKDAAVAYATVDMSYTGWITAQYYVSNNRHLAIISLSASTKEELNELEKIIDTIEFIK
jgi:hypothetical protein